MREFGNQDAYNRVMARILNAERRQPPSRPAGAEAPAGWLESFEASEAQIAAGQTVPLDPVLDRLRATLARMIAAETK